MPPAACFGHTGAVDNRPHNPNANVPESAGHASRRAFLAGAGAAAVAGLGAACSGSNDGAIQQPEAAASTAVATEQPEPEVESAPEPPVEVPEPNLPILFRGDHQVGLLADAPPSGLVAAFDVLAGSRAELAEAVQLVSAEIERLMAGEPSVPGDEFLPPVDSGAVGAESSTSGVSVALSVGASLFDDRFGLADLRPRELIAMPRFFNDRLVRPELSHGDLAITVNAPNQQAAAFALHQIVRVSDRRLRLRWVQEGFNERLPEQQGSIAPTRNLLGFRDGTSNLDPLAAEVMNTHVWVQPGDDEPEWAIGGTYQATRIIRMLIEFWATAALVRQEQIFGRHRDTGAPLGQANEGDEPAFATSPNDDTIPRRSHIRLANPRTPGGSRILRRGFSYLNGADERGTLDQGLLFLCYQRSLTRGFLEVQSRLDGEPLEDYVKPIGGGLFFAVPGPGPDGWLGQSLLEA